ncbi:hypothetical protein KIH39_11055 [Telmatocola sphagniphila]|uniref:DNA polymerase III subunit delta n=1 Tax=Telmatocola sphagniphila TaxID=1123043 RepID=A0A8E6EV30_9BACT|nr:DNA polymerase III subunit delta' [Telmatocola sphagniphila]QVL34414.1 hypothetical protein KIH39_11055 [Telmatocola sphagniphila]
MSWNRMLGHDRLIKGFQAVWTNQRLGQAYLFIGPRGVGKFTFARELARAILCEKSGPGLEACEQCRSCILAGAGTHPDLLMAAKPEDKNELVIAVIRDLCEQLVRKPALGTRKVAIVDDAGEMNEEAANCFLKTLEEPAPGSILILIGGPSADRQLRTIQSRCQIIHFAGLSESNVRQVISSRKEPEYSVDELSIALAAGSPGLAIEFAEPHFRELRQQLVADLLKPRSDAFAWAEQWLKSLENFSKDTAGQRVTSRMLIRVLIELARLAWHWHLGDRAGNAEISGPVSQFAQRFSYAQLDQLLFRLQKTDEQIDRMLQMNYAIESMAMDIVPVG